MYSVRLKIRLQKLTNVSVGRILKCSNFGAQRNPNLFASVHPWTLLIYSLPCLLQVVAVPVRQRRPLDRLTDSRVWLKQILTGTDQKRGQYEDQYRAK